MSDRQGLLIILGGLPGAGKSSIARELARQIGAMHVRIDTIEQAMRNAEPPVEQMWDHGYRVAYAVAADNLRLGCTVVADSVNPIAIEREAWRDVALQSEVPYIEVEVVCSDREEHRRRVETRVTDVEGLKLPTWQDVLQREYEAWDADLVVDTAMVSVQDSVAAICSALENV